MLRIQATKDGGELAAELPKLRNALKDRDAQMTELHKKQQAALESLAAELSMSAARNEDLRRKMASLEDVLQGKDKTSSEFALAQKRLEEENSRLQEHATLAAHQFHKLGDESARLLHACQVTSRPSQTSPPL